MDLGPTLEFNDCSDDEMVEKFKILQRNTGIQSVKPVIKNTLPKDPIINILVVDDDQINILVAKNFLNSFTDFKFDVANNGSDAINIITNNARENKYYDVILMDCNMPIMDGFETSRVLNQMIINRKIPNLSIIACTANASPLDYEFCFKSGMCDYISKPFSKSELRAKIKKNYAKKKEI
jgi:CheY-like chemotaxis protein